MNFKNSKCKPKGLQERKIVNDKLIDSCFRSKKRLGWELSNDYFPQLSWHLFSICLNLLRWTMQTQNILNLKMNLLEIFNQQVYLICVSSTKNILIQLFWISNIEASSKFFIDRKRNNCLLTSVADIFLCSPAKQFTFSGRLFLRNGLYLDFNDQMII